jgi:hypothetical protein
MNYHATLNRTKGKKIVTLMYMHAHYQLIDLHVLNPEMEL